MTNTIVYQVRKARKFTGTRKRTETKDIWQQFLPICPVVYVNGMMVCHWVDIDIDNIPWATPEDAANYKKASDFEYMNGR